MRRSILTIVCILAALLAVFPAAAQVPYFVKATNPAYSGNPHDVVGMGGIGYLAASSSINFSNGQWDEELWRTDGTAAGTYLVKDICPGALGSKLKWMTAVGSTLFFAASDCTHGVELWKSDGTAAGTSMVIELNAGSNDSYINSPVAYQGALYFTSTMNGSGRSLLFRSDGTAAGTQPLSTTIGVNPPTGVDTNRRLTIVNNKLLFAGYDWATNTPGIFTSDGTPAGTVMVKAVPSPGSDMIAASGQAFFTANDPTFRSEVWRTDGTAAGTFMIADINPVNTGFNGSSEAWLYGTVGNICLFSAWDGSLKRKMWRSDGTAAGTFQLADVYTGQSEQPNDLTSNGTFAVWEAVPPSGSGSRQLWVTDGTLAGTRMLKLFRFCQDFMAADGMIYFRGDDSGGADAELWRTNGTVAGTTLYADILPGTSASNPYPIGVAGNRAYLAATGTSAQGSSGSQLWAFQMCNSSPQPAVSVTPAAVCPNGTSGNATVTNAASFTSFAWTIANGVFDSPATGSTITYHATSTAPVQLTVTANATDGCSNRTTTVSVPTNVLPAPVITYAPDTLCPNATIASANVTNYSSPTTFLWTIANGAFDSGPTSAAVGFHATGSAPVQLTVQVTDANGCKATGTSTVPIRSISAPVITASGPLTFCAGGSVTLTSSPASSYLWSTGATTPSITVAASGSFTVTITDPNGCSATSVPATVTVNANPATPVITASGPLTFCTGGSVTLTAPASASYLWSNGATTQSITVTTAGSYGVTVSNAAGCSATSSPVAVTVTAAPAAPSISLDTPAVCPNASDFASASGTWASYAWSIQNGVITSTGPGSSTVVFQAGPAGPVTLTVTVTDANGCSVSSSVDVPLRSAAPPSISLDTPDVCPLSSDFGSVDGTWSNYAWSIQNGVITSASNGRTVVFQAGPSAPVTLSVIVTDAGGCTATQSVTIPLRSVPPPAISLDTPDVCPLSSDFGSVDGTWSNYSWSIQNGVITSASNGRTVVFQAGPSAPVTLSVVVTDSRGCSATQSVTIPLRTVAPPAITLDTPDVCPLSSDFASVDSPWASYSWSIQNGVITSASNGRTVVFQAGPSAPVSLSVVVTTSGGCSATKSITVPLRSVPPPSITLDTPDVCPLSSDFASVDSVWASYSWSIQDGVLLGDSHSRTVTFQSGPSAPVTLSVVVTDTRGCSATQTITVPLRSIPAPGITLDTPDVCPLGTDRASLDSSWRSFTWTIQNGVLLGNPNSRTVTFQAGQSGPVTLTVDVTDTRGCTGTKTVTVPLRNPPPPVITLNQPDVCPLSTGNATASSDYLSYAWSIENGTIVGTGPRSVVFQAGSTGPVKLTAMVMDAGACSVSQTVTVPLRSIPPPTITLDQPDVCPLSTGSATASSNFSIYSWSIQNGTIIGEGSSGPRSVVFQASSSGPVTLTLVARDAGGCTGTATVTIPLRSIPPPVITLDQLDVCPLSTGSATASSNFSIYSWSIQNGTIVGEGASGPRSVVFQAGSSGPVTLTLVARDAGGCTGTASATVPLRSIPPPTITLGSPDVCPNSTGSAEASSNFSIYSWSINNGTIIGEGPNGPRSVIYRANASGPVTLTLVARDAGGCTGTASATIPLRNLAAPVVTASGPTTFCAGGSVTLAAPAGYSGYLWSNGATTSSIAVTAAGSYSVTVSDAGGCSATSSVTNVSINAAPDATVTASGSTTFCAGGSVTLTAPSGASSYLWSTGATTQSIVAQESGAYSVTVTNGSGCSATSAATAVTKNAPPNAGITADGPVTFCTGGSVNLSGPAGMASYLWSTGEATRTIHAAPSASTTYTLTVVDANGCSDTSARTVSVYPPPAATITPSHATTFCESGNVILFGGGSGSYLWSTGETTANITVTTSGTYTLTVTNSLCSSTASIDVTVLPAPPKPAITADGPLTFCAGGSVTLTAPAGYTYSWSNPAGASSRSIVATASGNYTVTVLSANGCSTTSDTVAVNVLPPPAAPVVTASGPTTFCDGGSVTLTAPASASYLWSNGATTQSIVATTAGSYSVTIGNASGCSSAASTPVAVTVNAAPPTPVITAGGPTTFCAGGSVTLTAPASSSYLWSTGATTQSITVSSSGSYSVSVTNASGCTAASAATTVTVNANLSATIAAGGPTTFCAGGSVTLTASAGTSYLWSNGATTPSISVNASGNYTVTVTNASGCSTTSAATSVTVNANPSATITPSGPTTFCAGGSVTLTAPASTSYLWSNGATTQSITVSATGNFSVTVRNASGCSSTSAATAVTVLANPQATITAGSNTTFCPGSSVTLTASAGSSYLWSNGATTQAITATAPGDYTVTVTNANGCSSTSAPKTVALYDVPPKPAITASGPLTFCQGGSVTLTAPAGYASYFWSNGATTQSVTLTDSRGITVTVSNGHCSTSSDRVDVNVWGYPDATITGVGSMPICPGGGSVTLVIGQSSGYTYLWSTGETTGNITVHQAGSYSVTITNQAGCSSTSQPFVVTAYTKPSAVVSGSAAMCAGGSATIRADLTGTAPFNVTWDDGVVQSNVTSPLFRTVSPGFTRNYTIAQFTDSASNCVGDVTGSAAVTVNAIPSTPSITASGATTFCEGGSVTLTSSAAAGYLWSNGATTQSIVVNTSGSYTVSATSAAGCSSAASAAKVVTVNPLPAQPAVTASGPTTFCAGGSVTLTAPASTSYLWSNGATTQSIAVTTSGNYSVTVKNASGCSSAASAAIAVTVNANPATPSITASGPTTFCTGGSVTLTAPAATSYLWSNGATTQSITVNASGSYSVSVSNASGCSATSAATAVTVNAPPATPAITASGPTTFCAGGSVTLTAPASASYLWSNGATTQAITVNTSGNFSVTVTNASGCSASSTITPVTVNALPATPTITAGGPTTFCSGGSVTLTSSAATSYLWSNGATTQSISVTATGNYSVTVSNASGCTATSAAKPVTVNASPSISAFSPVLQSVQKGRAAQRITVTATGTSLTYQWYSGTSPSTASPISGATTNSYLPPTNVRGTFKYWVRVTGAGTCTADSTTATVTVN